MKGFDCSASAGTYATQLAQLGYEFACRYYRRGGGGMSLAEARLLSAAGLGLVSVFQYTSNTPGYFGPINAETDAVAAVTKAKVMGQPKLSAIYFAVDTDITTKTIEGVVAYFQKVAEIVKGEGWAVGAYGDDLVCQTLTGMDLADHAWLTNAKGWMTDKAFADWDIKQTSMPFTLPFGLEIDADEAIGFEVAGMWRA